MDSLQLNQELDSVILVSLFQLKLLYHSLLDFLWSKSLETALSSISSQWSLFKFNIQFFHVSGPISKLPDIFFDKERCTPILKCSMDVQFSCTASFQKSLGKVSGLNVIILHVLFNKFLQNVIAWRFLFLHSVDLFPFSWVLGWHSNFFSFFFL